MARAEDLVQVGFTAKQADLLADGSYNVPDTANIQALLTAAAYASADAVQGTIGRVVHLPPGRYLITSTLIIPHHVILEGSGKQNTILEASGLGSGVPIVKFAGEATYGQTHSQLRNITLDGAAISGVVGLDFYDGTGGNTQNNYSRVSDVYFYDCAVGARVDSTASNKFIIYSSLENCQFEGCLTSVKIDHGVNFFTIRNCNFNITGTGRIGIKFESTYNGNFVTIAENSFDGTAHDATVYSIQVETIGGAQRPVALITGNYIEGTAGIYVKGGYTTTIIRGNVIDEVWQGLLIEGRGNIIADNYIGGNSADSSIDGVYGIHLTSTSSYNQIGQNYFNADTEELSPAIRIFDEGANNVVNAFIDSNLDRLRTYEVGDRIYDATPAAGSIYEAICTQAGSGGTPPAATGTISAGDLYHCTMSDATYFAKGMYITIAGVSGIKKITNKTGSVIRLLTAADVPVTGAAVARSAPVFINQAGVVI